MVGNTKAKRPSVSLFSTLKIFADRVSLSRTDTRRAKGAYMRSQCVAKYKPPIFQPINPCPICGAETTLAEIEPHPLHTKFEIHGYLCGQCGPSSPWLCFADHRFNR